MGPTVGLVLEQKKLKAVAGASGGARGPGCGQGSNPALDLLRKVTRWGLGERTHSAGGGAAQIHRRGSRQEMQGDQRTEAAQSQEEVGASSQPRKKGGDARPGQSNRRERKFLEEKHPWEKALPWEARVAQPPER